MSISNLITENGQRAFEYITDKIWHEHFLTRTQSWAIPAEGGWPSLSQSFLGSYLHADFKNAKRIQAKGRSFRSFPRKNFSRPRTSCVNDLHCMSQVREVNQGIKIAALNRDVVEALLLLAWSAIDYMETLSRSASFQARGEAGSGVMKMALELPEKRLTIPTPCRHRHQTSSLRHWAEGPPDRHCQTDKIVLLKSFAWPIFIADGDAKSYIIFRISIPEARGCAIEWTGARDGV